MSGADSPARYRSGTEAAKRCGASLSAMTPTTRRGGVQRHVVV